MVSLTDDFRIRSETTIDYRSTGTDDTYYYTMRELATNPTTSKLSLSESRYMY